MPAVENAAIPQYKAFPYEVIVVPSIPISEIYNPAEKIIHRTIKRNTILIMGVCVRMS
jgi:hypothetical protein